MTTMPEVITYIRHLEMCGYNSKIGIIKCEALDEDTFYIKFLIGHKLESEKYLVRDISSKLEISESRVSVFSLYSPDYHVVLGDIDYYFEEHNFNDAEYTKGELFEEYDVFKLVNIFDSKYILHFNQDKLVGHVLSCDNCQLENGLPLEKKFG